MTNQPSAKPVRPIILVHLILGVLLLVYAAFHATGGIAEAARVNAYLIAANPTAKDPLSSTQMLIVQQETLRVVTQFRHVSACWVGIAGLMMLGVALVDWRLRPRESVVVTRSAVLALLALGMGFPIIPAFSEVAGAQMSIGLRSATAAAGVPLSDAQFYFAAWKSGWAAESSVGVGFAFLPCLVIEAALAVGIYVRGGRAKSRRARRLNAGQCGDCGYDMRAISGVCPECGQESRFLNRS